MLFTESNFLYYLERYTVLMQGVDPVFVEDALILAKARTNEDISLKDATAKVLEIYPFMMANQPSEEVLAKAEKALSTGIRTGASTPAVTGVEAAFIAKNPGIKL
jgi:hypothetical protein